MPSNTIRKHTQHGGPAIKHVSITSTIVYRGAGAPIICTNILVSIYLSAQPIYCILYRYYYIMPIYWANIISKYGWERSHPWRRRYWRNLVPFVMSSEQLLGSWEGRSFINMPMLMAKHVKIDYVLASSQFNTHCFQVGASIISIITSHHLSSPDLTNTITDTNTMGCITCGKKKINRVVLRLQVSFQTVWSVAVGSSSLVFANAFAGWGVKRKPQQSRNKKNTALQTASSELQPYSTRQYTMVYYTISSLYSVFQNK